VRDGSDAGVRGRMRTSKTPEHELQQDDGAVAYDAGEESCVRVASARVTKAAHRVY
jgi:hypothetical protein